MTLLDFEIICIKNLGAFGVSDIRKDNGNVKGYKDFLYQYVSAESDQIISNVIYIKL